MYLTIKHFVKSFFDWWYSIANKSDAWIMSQSGEEIQTKVFMYGIGILVMSALAWGLVGWLENTDEEDKAIKSILKNLFSFMGIAVVWTILIIAISFFVVHNLWGRI